MMFINIRKYPALLWGVSLLFSVESMNVTIPEVSSPTSTAQHMTTTEADSHLTSLVLHHETEHQPSPRHSESTFIPNNKATVTQIPNSSTQSHSLDSRGSTGGVVVKNTSVGTKTSSGPQLDSIATVPSASTTVPGAAQSSRTANVSETEKPTEHPLSQQSVMTSTDLSTTASAVGLVSSSQGRSTSKPNITSTNSTTVSITTPRSSTIIISSTSGHVFDPSNTSWPSSITKASTTNTEFLSTYQAISPTRPVSSSKVPYTKGPSLTTESPPTSEAISTISGISTTAISTSPSAGVLPFLTTKSPLATTTVTHTESPSGAEVQPCSTTRRSGVVNQCLIAIASLAGLATIFMVSTIVLCTKLSTRKHHYRIRESQQETEMVCISALLPERNCIYGRHYNPKSNGALLPFNDSDEDGGDNLTLSSFLPENDHVV